MALVVTVEEAVLLVGMDRIVHGIQIEDRLLKEFPASRWSLHP
jgi:hypothetical protein